MLTVVVSIAPAGIVPVTVAVAFSAKGPAAVYVSEPVVTLQASVNGVAGSVAVIVMTPPAPLAWTRLPSGSCVAGSGCTAALIVAAMLAASAPMLVSVAFAA